MKKKDVSKYIKDVSVLRRILFAASVLPPQLPQFWGGGGGGGVVVEFATLGIVSAVSDSRASKSIY